MGYVKLRSLLEITDERYFGGVVDENGNEYVVSGTVKDDNKSVEADYYRDVLSECEVVAIRDNKYIIEEPEINLEEYMYQDDGDDDSDDLPFDEDDNDYNDESDIKSCDKCKHFNIIEDEYTCKYCRNLQYDMVEDYFDEK